MPIFEYRCEECAVDFEVLIRGTEQPACPTCGSDRLEKLLSATATHVTPQSLSLPMADNSCPPPEMGPCSPACCRLP